MDLFQDLLSGMDRISITSLLAALFLAGLIEVVFPPFPGDLSFVAGGVVAGRRGFPLAWPVLAAFTGTMLAAAVLFFLGKLCGRPLLRRPFFARLLPEARLARLEAWFDRYGLWLIIGSRFLAVIRSGIALAAGMAGLRPGLSFGGMAAGIALHAALLVVGGALLREGWEAFAARVGLFSWLLAAAAAVVFVLVRAFGRRRRWRG